MVKKTIVISLSFLLMLLFLTSFGRNKEQKVSCSMCNGSGQVKYYFGDGDNDYNLGSCTSCNEKGYVMIVPSGNYNGGKSPIAAVAKDMSRSLSQKRTNLEKAEVGVLITGMNIMRLWGNN